MGDKESFQEFEFDWYSWFAIVSLFGGAVIFTDKCLQTQNISTEIIQKKKKIPQKLTHHDARQQFSFYAQIYSRNIFTNTKYIQTIKVD